MRRGFPGVAELRPAVAAVLGPGARLRSVTRLAGGSKKGVYRLGLDGHRPVVAYLWDVAENYWPAAAGDDDDPLADASGAERFETASATLAVAGVRTPAVYGVDRTRAVYPADFALVEDVDGGSLETLLATRPAAGGAALVRLGRSLAAMAGDRSAAPGRVGQTRPGGRSCPRIVLDRARADLAEAVARDQRIAAARGQLEAALDGLATLRPRGAHSLVHGELGPDHVLIDGRGEPVLIDVEGLMHFDPEWEHAFLRLRFGPHYPPLRIPHLETERLRLYSLALYLSLVAGPLRLLDGDFPDRAPMRAIAEANLRRALAFVR